MDWEVLFWISISHTFLHNSTLLSCHFFLNNCMCSVFIGLVFSNAKGAPLFFYSCEISCSSAQHDNSPFFHLSRFGSFPVLFLCLQFEFQIRGSTRPILQGFACWFVFFKRHLNKQSDHQSQKHSQPSFLLFSKRTSFLLWSEASSISWIRKRLLCVIKLHLERLCFLSLALSFLVCKMGMTKAFTTTQSHAEQLCPQSTLQTRVRQEADGNAWKHFAEAVSGPKRMAGIHSRNN